MNWLRENIQIVVLDPEWQALRKGFLGRWKRETEACISELAAFVERRTDDRGLRCAYNYLTGSLFRTRQVVHPRLDELLIRVRAEVVKRKTGP